MSSANEVVITGMGVVTSAGPGVGALRQAAIAGKSFVAPITEFDVTNLPVKIAAQARTFEPATVLDAKQLRLAARIVQLAMGAAMEATGSGEPGTLGDVTKIGTIVGTSTGGLDVIAEQMEVLAVKGPRRVSPFSVPQLMDNAAAAWIALRWGFRGPAYSISTGCATSLDAIGLAFDLIRNGRLEACLAGGADAPVIPFMMASFAKSGLLSSNNADPELASRPFDAARDGFVLGEGAGLLFLERRDRAEKRGAKILARLLGYGICSAPQHDLMQPAADGSGLVGAMEVALKQAGIAPSDVGYISANAKGSKLEDAAEAAAIRTLFGEHTDRVPIGATKSLVGYTLAASGAISSAAAILAVSEGLLSPAATFRNPDPACDIKVVAGEAVHQKVSYALANGIGFGGHNTCLVFGAP